MSPPWRLRKTRRLCCDFTRRKVYRVTSDGKAEVYFDPSDKYIWSLAILNDGSLAVGTGDNGKLYRVRAAGANPESSLLVKTNQTHVMSLAVSKQGDLIAGTDPGGLVVRISADGKAFGLYDAPLREIHALSAADDGSIYALALSDAASTTRAATSTGDAATAAATATEDAAATPQVQPATPSKSRNDLNNVRSAIFRILPDGGTDVVWSSTPITGFALVAGRTGSCLVHRTRDESIRLPTTAVTLSCFNPRKARYLQWLREDRMCTQSQVIRENSFDTANRW